MSKLNILITGINGFMGSSLRNFIRREYPSWNIYGMDYKAEETKKTFRMDITNKKKFKRILCEIKPAYIFHLAGTIASNNIKRLLHSNVVSTFVILDAVKEIKNYSPRIVIPSSAAEYGEIKSSDSSFREEAFLNPVSLYGFSKAAQTKLSLMFSSKGLDVVVARIFNVIGAGVSLNLSIGKFAHKLALIKKGKKKSVIYTRNIDTERDFLDITDVCKYLVAVAIYGKKGEVYNVCREKKYAIRYLLDKLIRISGIKDIKIIENKKYDKESDLKSSFGSTKKLKKTVGSFTLVPIDKSLRDSYFYYLSRV